LGIISIFNCQRPEKLGYILYATGKTALYLNMHGIATNAVKKISDGAPNILDLIETDKIKLIINTPTRGRAPQRDGFKIRRKAVESSIPCLTSMDTAFGLLKCLQLGKKPEELEIYNLKIFEKPDTENNG
jgi:carbamoyl-phosphate synthase large subunit